MKNNNTISCDTLVVGAGFAGSLMALCLRQSGFDVCVVEKGRHPRFAIGESSTPIADMILRNLASRYDLPWLKPFSRYGSWQQEHPEVACGLKRGFSYFRHRAGEPFQSEKNHKNELLVAASVSDEQSDTNWLRADFDAFLAGKLQDYDVTYFDNTDITQVARGDDKRWRMKADSGTAEITIESDFFVDATGSSQFLNRHLDVPSTSDGFKTCSRAIYSHFSGVKRWEAYLEAAGSATEVFPYTSDHSALHHLLDDAWMWMLRFNDDRCSAGIMLNMHTYPLNKTDNPLKTWETFIANYPSLNRLFQDAEPAAEPGKIIQTGRLQRKLAQAAGPGWAALPHTTGFVDPMHSTGIAHTLSGVERLADLLSAHFENQVIRKRKLKHYEKSVREELDFIDLLVAGSYASINHFELFGAYVMIYFIAAIRYEQHRLRGEIPEQFLCAGDATLKKIVAESFDEVNKLRESTPSQKAIVEFRENVKQRIAPYNTAGLLDPDAGNMYHHTAVDIQQMNTN